MRFRVYFVGPVDFALSKFATLIGRKHFSDLYPIYILQSPAISSQVTRSPSNPENMNTLLNDSQDLTNVSMSISDTPSVSSDMSDKVHDTSEELLKITLKLMAKIGWQNSSQFKQVIFFLTF